jgi:diguanylate cyclase (GGDEF)-like protein
LSTKIRPRIFLLLRFVLPVLLLLTIMLPVWHHIGMNRVFEIGPASGNVFSVTDDHVHGGKSVAVLTRTEKSVVMDCLLSKEYQWPYCSMNIALAMPPNGVDLTSYDSITFDVSVTGPDSRFIRFYLENFEDGISNPTVPDSFKVNEIEFETKADGEINVPIKLFRVASWWASEQKVPLLRTDMRIDRVPYVELSTGSLAPPGKHRIEVRAIKFYGKWISQSHLLMMLVGAWLLFGAGRLIAELREFRNTLITTRLRLARMHSINEALKLETKELAGQARTDALTGALNRQGLRDYLIKQWQGTGEPEASVIFTDLDHFKQVNDQYGHSVGDEILRQFVQLIEREIRTSDRLVRWGGEEFLIVCSTAEAEQASRLAEKLRAAVTEYNWPQQLQITSSFGVAVHVNGEAFGDMIKRADRALYRAKASGRNCVEVA